MQNHGVVALVTRMQGCCSGCGEVEELRWHIDDVGALCNGCTQLILLAETVRVEASVELAKESDKQENGR